MDAPKLTNGKAQAEAARVITGTMKELAARLSGERKEKQVPDDAAFADRYPFLWQWLSATQIADDFDKDPARLSLNVEGGLWRISLTDSALECSLSILGLTVASGLDQLEAELASGNAHFQLFKRRGAKKLIVREKKKKGKG